MGCIDCLTGHTGPINKLSLCISEQDVFNTDTRDLWELWLWVFDSHENSKSALTPRGSEVQWQVKYIWRSVYSCITLWRHYSFSYVVVCLIVVCRRIRYILREVMYMGLLSTSCTSDTLISFTAKIITAFNNTILIFSFMLLWIKLPSVYRYLYTHASPVTLLEWLINQ